MVNLPANPLGNQVNYAGPLKPRAPIERDIAELAESLKGKARRASTMVRRCAMSADLRRMLTLTTRDNLEEFRESRHQAELLLRRLRRSEPGIRYVGAPEQQKRGAWHWHILVDRYLDADSVRSMWRGVCGDGNIDLTLFPDPLTGALYAAKYVRKSFGEKRLLIGGGARYVRSRNIEVICEKVSQQAAYEVLAAAGWSGECVALDTGGEWAASWR
jgi:hypothetical protein